MKLTNDQDAYEQATQGGYKMAPEYELKYRDSDQELFLDPAFWQALGKARGWSSESLCSRCDQPMNDCDHSGGGSYHLWMKWAIKYFKTRLSNGDLAAFWQSLP